MTPQTSHTTIKAAARTRKPNHQKMIKDTNKETTIDFAASEKKVYVEEMFETDQ